MRLCCIDTSGDARFKINSHTVQYSWVDASGVHHTLPTRAPEVLRNNKIIDPQLRHLLVRFM
ncbi:hypothetical protein F5Y12DRAFT_773699 [Xylaria sp. FL1777]|nr:hypothetical protein F5Y12DRAFT_773699 [Xylaria sp. FL1777]